MASSATSTPKRGLLTSVDEQSPKWQGPGYLLYRRYNNAFNSMRMSPLVYQALNEMFKRGVLGDLVIPLHINALLYARGLEGNKGEILCISTSFTGDTVGSVLLKTSYLPLGLALNGSGEYVAVRGINVITICKLVVMGDIISLEVTREINDVTDPSVEISNAYFAHCDMLVVSSHSRTDEDIISIYYDKDYSKEMKTNGMPSLGTIGGHGSYESSKPGKRSKLMVCSSNLDMFILNRENGCLRTLYPLCNTQYLINGDSSKDSMSKNVHEFIDREFSEYSSLRIDDPMCEVSKSYLGICSLFNGNENITPALSKTVNTVGTDDIKDYLVLSVKYNAGDSPDGEEDGLTGKDNTSMTEMQEEKYEESKMITGKVHAIVVAKKDRLEVYVGVGLTGDSTLNSFNIKLRETFDIKVRKIIRINTSYKSITGTHEYYNLPANEMAMENFCSIISDTMTYNPYAVSNTMVILITNQNTICVLDMSPWLLSDNPTEPSMITELPFFYKENSRLKDNKNIIPIGFFINNDFLIYISLDKTYLKAPITVNLIPVSCIKNTIVSASLEKSVFSQVNMKLKKISTSVKPSSKDMTDVFDMLKNIRDNQKELEEENQRIIGQEVKKINELNQGTKELNKQEQEYKSTVKKVKANILDKRARILKGVEMSYYADNMPSAAYGGSLAQLSNRLSELEDILRQVIDNTIEEGRTIRSLRSKPTEISVLSNEVKRLTQDTNTKFSKILNTNAGLSSPSLSTLYMSSPRVSDYQTVVRSENHLDMNKSISMGKMRQTRSVMDNSIGSFSPQERPPLRAIRTGLSEDLF